MALWSLGVMPAIGGDSSVVQHQLRDVQQIQASQGVRQGAFAAILGDGSVVTWGSARLGVATAVWCRISCANVQQIQASMSGHLRQSWVMDLWSHGVSARQLVVTAVRCRSSCKTVQLIQASRRSICCNSG